MTEEREKALSAILTLAENNFQFRKEVIDNLEDTIRDWGFVLNAVEMREVRRQHSQWAGMSDFEILEQLGKLHTQLGLPGFPPPDRRR
jgi:hypothetical protein